MRALLAVVLSMLLPACASFESGELPHLDAWPPPTAAQPRPVAVAFEGLPTKFDGWRPVTADVLRASGRYGAVTLDDEARDGRHIRFVVTHSRPDGLPTVRAYMIACALTLGVFPARAAHAFAIEAQFHGDDGAHVGSVTRSVESSTWVGWVFLFALPFAGVGMTGLVEDTMRSIVAEGVARGWA